MKCTYYRTCSRIAPIVPARLVERQSHGFVRLEITKTTYGQDTYWKKGEIIDTPAENYVEKCGHQRGEWIGNSFNKSIYVRRVH